MQKLIYIALFAIGIAKVQAQVGIGTTLPHPSSALHIKDNKRGLLLPRVGRTTDVINTGGLPGGLVVFDSVNNMLYYYDEASTKWQSIAPLILNRTTGAISPSAPGTTFQGQFQGTVNTNLAANDINTFSGNGTIPIGGIIMWSGDSSTVPDGWAICNGKIVNGLQTPDLRGRFIVGYVDDPTQGYTDDPRYAPNNSNNAISDVYKTIGNPYGFARVTLDSTQLPTHMHDVLDYGHHHSITGEVMQKEGSSTKSVTALDIGNDTWNGVNTFTNKISDSKTGTYLRKSGGIYSATIVPNPPHYIAGCTVWRYTCTTTGGSTFQSSAQLTPGTPYGSGTTTDLYGTDESGYQICTPSAVGYCGIGTSKDYVGSTFQVSGCTQNSNWDNSSPNNCVSDHWDPRVSEGTTIRYNEKWTVQGHENRPPYYVMAFIMRIR